MRKIIITTLLLTAVVSLQAQNKRKRLTTEERAAKQTEMLNQELKLSADQQKQVAELKLKVANESRDFRTEQRKLSRSLKNLNKQKQKDIAAELRESFVEGDVRFKKLHAVD